MASARELRALLLLLCSLLLAALSYAQNTTQHCASNCAPCPPCPVCPTCTRPIPLGYRHYPGIGYYRVDTTPTTWMAAKKACEREGAYLVIVDTQDEYQLVTNILKTVPNINWDVHVGFHDLYKEGTYRTVLGQPIEAKFWQDAEPNNGYGKENCGAFRYGGFNDVLCDLKLSFVCELDI